MPTANRTAAGTEPRRGHLGLTLALLAFAQLIISLDYTIVFVALPDIGDALGFSAQTLQLVISAYAVAFGGVLLLGGRAADLFGRRRMFATGLFLYGVSSLVGALANAPEVLVGARAVQGLGGAVLFPATLSLVNTIFAEGRERNHALGVWAGAGAGGMVLGSLLGGVLTQAFGWEAVFFVNVPLAAVAMLMAFAFIGPDTARTTGRTFDLPGALSATIGMTLLVFALVQGPESGWGSPAIVAGAAVAVIALVAFVSIEGRTRDPLMPLRLLRNRDLRLGVLTTFLFMATFGTWLYFFTVYLQTVHGYSPLRTGLASLVPMGAIFVGSNLGGHVLTRFGIRATLLGSLTTGVVGMVLLALAMSPEGSYAAMVPGLIVLSLGQGVTFPTMFAAAATGVAPHEQGIASGMASTGQQVGSALGLAVLVAIANSGTDGLGGEALRVATADGLRNAIIGAAIGAGLMVVVALSFRRAPRREATTRGTPAQSPAQP